MIIRLETVGLFLISDCYHFASGKYFLDGFKGNLKGGAEVAPPVMLQLNHTPPPQTMPTSRAYRAKTASPLAMHRRWIQQDMDQTDADTMRAYDRAQYYANEDGCHTGTDNDA